MTTLILATRNEHKVREIQSLVGKCCECRSMAELAASPSVVEDAGSFAGNAAKKAQELARWLASSPELLVPFLRSHPPSPRTGPALCLADDSGLEVDALGGAPGVNSARFAALEAGGSANSPDAANNAKLLRLLSGVPAERRTARFRCVIALVPVLVESASESAVCSARESELRTELFEGTCEGHIETTPRGNHGFGYDPLFVPRGYSQSFAELGDEIKNRISHRAQALCKVRDRLNGAGVIQAAVPSSVE